MLSSAGPKLCLCMKDCTDLKAKSKLNTCTLNCTALLVVDEVLVSKDMHSRPYDVRLSVSVFFFFPGLSRHLGSPV